MEELQINSDELAFTMKLAEFVKTLSAPLSEGEAKRNKFADNSLFLPIQQVEDKLNYYFGGLWQMRNFKYQVIVNEIMGDLELGIYHPVLKEWLWRTGTGGVMIQMKAEYETGTDGKRRKKQVDVLDVQRKITNTIVKDAGHLKAECLKNAAKSLGRQFGSALNRESEDIFSIDNVKDIEDVLKGLEMCENKTELKAFYDTLPNIQKKDVRVQNLFKFKRNKLQTK